MKRGQRGDAGRGRAWSEGGSEGGQGGREMEEWAANRRRATSE